MLFVFTHVAAANAGRAVLQKKCALNLFFFIFIYEESLFSSFLIFYSTSSEQMLAYQELAQSDTQTIVTHRRVFILSSAFVDGFAKETYAPPWT